jgi:hypothetical protein
VKRCKPFCVSNVVKKRPNGNVAFSLKSSLPSGEWCKIEVLFVMGLSMTNNMKIETAGDALWYGILIIAETVALPYYVCQHVIEKANKQYKKYK